MTKIYKKEGFFSFYDGLLVSIIGVCFYHGTGFYVITNLKLKMIQETPDIAKKWQVDFSLGAFISIIS